MVNAIEHRVHAAATWSVGLSVLMIGAGALAIGLPLVAGLAVTALVAWLLLFSGVLHLVFAWRSGSATHVVWELLLGVVYGATGLYMLAHPVAGLASLTVAVAAYLVLEGIIEFALAAQTRSGWLLVDGLVTLVLAVLVATTWPSSAAWVIGTLVGISMLFSGVARLMVSLAVRRLAA